MKLLSVFFFSAFLTLFALSEVVLGVTSGAQKKSPLPSTLRVWDLGKDLSQDFKNDGSSAWRLQKSLTKEVELQTFVNFPDYEPELPYDVGKVRFWFDKKISYLGVGIPLIDFKTPSGLEFLSGVPFVAPVKKSPVVIRWRSPLTGQVGVQGRLKDIDGSCGDGISWHLFDGKDQLGSGSIANGGAGGFEYSALSVTKVSSSIYLVVDQNENQDCDATQVEFSIHER